MSSGNVVPPKLKTHHLEPVVSTLRVALKRALMGLSEDGFTDPKSLPHVLASLKALIDATIRQAHMKGGPSGTYVMKEASWLDNQYNTGERVRMDELWLMVRVLLGEVRNDELMRDIKRRGWDGATLGEMLEVEDITEEGSGHQVTQIEAAGTPQAAPNQLSRPKPRVRGASPVPDPPQKPATPPRRTKPMWGAGERARPPRRHRDTQDDHTEDS